MKKVFTCILLVINSTIAYTQIQRNENIKGQSGQICVGYSNLTFLNPTKKYFSNLTNPSLNLMLYKNRFFINLSYTQGSIKFLKDSLILQTNTLYKNANTKIEHGNVVFGYRLVMTKNIYLDPYFGFTRSSFNFSKDDKLNHEYYSKLGFCSGFLAYWYINPDNKRHNIWFLYINNRISWLRFRKINTNLGNYTFQSEIGLGFRFDG